MVWSNPLAPSHPLFSAHKTEQTMPNNQVSARFLLESLKALKLSHSFDANKLQEIIDWLAQSPNNRILLIHLSNYNSIPALESEIDTQVDHPQPDDLTTSCRTFTVWTSPAPYSRPHSHDISSTHNTESPNDTDLQIRQAEECFHRAVKMQRMMDSLPLSLRDVPQQILLEICFTGQSVLQLHSYENEVVIEKDSPDDIQPILI